MTKLRKQKILAILEKESIDVNKHKRSHQVLQDWIKRKQNKKPTVGYRILSSFLGYSPTTLRLIFSGQVNLTQTQASQFAFVMQLDDKDRQYFLNMCTVNSLSKEIIAHIRKTK